jgi:hypothetical protein
MLVHLEGAVSPDDLLDEIHRLDSLDRGAARRGPNGHCSCGSGRKYRHCHGSAERPFRARRGSAGRLSGLLAEVVRPVLEKLGPIPPERLDVVLRFAALAWNISREPDRVTQAVRMAMALEGMGGEEARRIEEMLAFMVGRAGRLYPYEGWEVLGAWSEPLPAGGYRIVAAPARAGQ